MKHILLHIAAPLLALILFASCGGDAPFTPKPRSYMRIDMPQHHYQTLDTAVLPFTFQYDDEALIYLKKNTPTRKEIDLVYPNYGGIVYLTYKRISSLDDLRGQTDTSYRFAMQHIQQASGMQPNEVADPRGRVFGTIYNITGDKTASTYQFYVTDSARHFLRGALFFNVTPNNDSLAPVISYIQADIDQLIESLRWR